MGTRPAIFKWRQTESGLILCAVRWYLRYSLSLRDVEELLEERGLNVDHTTVWRWVQYYGPELGSDCDSISSRQTSPGEWTKPTFVLRVAGATCTGPSIPGEPPSISCCQRCATPMLPSACFARHSAIDPIPSLE